MVSKLRITYTKSAIGYPRRQKDTIRALGFHRLNNMVEKDDTPTVRGMIARVAHLVRVEEIDAATPDGGVGTSGERAGVRAGA